MHHHMNNTKKLLPTNTSFIKDIKCNKITAVKKTVIQLRDNYNNLGKMSVL